MGHHCLRGIPALTDLGCQCVINDLFWTSRTCLWFHHIIWSTWIVSWILSGHGFPAPGGADQTTESNGETSVLTSIFPAELHVATKTDYILQESLNAQFHSKSSQWNTLMARDTSSLYVCKMIWLHHRRKIFLVMVDSVLNICHRVCAFPLHIERLMDASLQSWGRIMCPLCVQDCWFSVQLICYMKWITKFIHLGARFRNKPV